MNRRGFLQSLVATVALTTGLARARLELIEPPSDLSYSEIVVRTLRNNAPLVAESIKRNNTLLRSLNAVRAGDGGFRA